MNVTLFSAKNLPLAIEADVDDSFWAAMPVGTTFVLPGLQPPAGSWPFVKSSETEAIREAAYPQVRTEPRRADDYSLRGVDVGSVVTNRLHRADRNMADRGSLYAAMAGPQFRTAQNAVAEAVAKAKKFLGVR